MITPTEDLRAKRPAAEAIEIMRRGDVFLDARRSPATSLVSREDLTRVNFSQNGHTAENLAANAADDPSAMRVHPGNSRCARNHTQLPCLKYGVERVTVFAIAVTQQAPGAVFKKANAYGQARAALTQLRIRYLEMD